MRSITNECVAFEIGKAESSFHPHDFSVIKNLQVWVNLGNRDEHLLNPARVNKIKLINDSQKEKTCYFSIYMGNIIPIEVLLKVFGYILG